MATEIAKAYVQIVPSMQGIQAQLSKSLAPAVEMSGKESGQKMGNALAGGLKSAASSIGKAFTAAAKAASPWDSVQLRRRWRRSASRR